MTDLRPVPRLVKCTGCGRWLFPAQWRQPADLALIDAVAFVILCEAECAPREAERIAEAAEGRRR